MQVHFRFSLILVCTGIWFFHSMQYFSSGLGSSTQGSTPAPKNTLGQGDEGFERQGGEYTQRTAHILERSHQQSGQRQKVLHFCPSCWCWGGGEFFLLVKLGLTVPVKIIWVLVLDTTPSYWEKIWNLSPLQKKSVLWDLQKKNTPPRPENLYRNSSQWFKYWDSG